MAIGVIATLAVSFTVPPVGSPGAIVTVGNVSFLTGAYVAIDTSAVTPNPMTAVPYLAKVLPSPPGTVLLQTVQLGSVRSGATILSGAVVQVAGPPGISGQPGPIGVGIPGVAGIGAPGPAGTSGAGATQTTATAVLPSALASVTLTVANGTAFPNGQSVIVSDGTNAFYGVVLSGGGTTSLVITCSGVLLGTPGATIALGATVSFYASGGSALPGVASMQIAAGVTGNTTVKATPGVLVAVLVTTPGSNAMTFVDGGTGKIIGKLGVNVPVGSYSMGYTAAVSIVAQGNAQNPAVTVEYM